MFKTRLWIQSLSIIYVSIFAAACRTDPVPQTPKAVVDSQPAPATRVAASETSDGNFFVTYIPKPDPIPLNELFTLEVNVFQDAQLRQHPSGVVVEVDAGMPAHHHGMNLAPRVQPVNDGHFLVTGMLFHMPGQWEIYIDVSKDGKKERARFEVEIQ